MYSCSHTPDVDVLINASYRPRRSVCHPRKFLLHYIIRVSVVCNNNYIHNQTKVCKGRMQTLKTALVGRYY